MNNLAALRLSLGRTNDAQELAERAYSVAQEVLGPRHPNTIDALQNLAAIYESSGRTEAATKLRSRLDPLSARRPL